MKKFTCFLAITFFSFLAFSQKTILPLIRNAQKAIEKKEYSSAEQLLRSAFSIDSTNTFVRYELANTLYQQKKYPEAIEIYKGINIEKQEDQEKVADIMHNMGNSLLKQKEFAPASECFKHSLRIRPTDDETRYNLALALKQIKKENKKNQPQQNKKNKQEKDKQKKKSKPQNQKNDTGQKNNKNEKEISPRITKQILEAQELEDKKTKKEYEKKIKNQKNLPQKRGKQW